MYLKEGNVHSVPALLLDDLQPRDKDKSAWATLPCVPTTYSLQI